jgi:dTMP kinase
MFIVFEGLDGSGKTTLVGKIASKLRAEISARPVITTSDPKGTSVGLQILNVISTSNLDNTTEMLLFFAARSALVNLVICPALARNEIVLCDRFIDSTYAYQCAGRGVSSDVVDDLCRNLPKPNLVIVLDVDNDTRLKRIANRGCSFDPLESKPRDFFDRVRDEYIRRAYSNADRYVIVDANQSIDKVMEKVYGIIISKLT